MTDRTNEHQPLAKLIWEASRRDEGSISAMGADYVAKEILVALERGELKLPATEKPQEPWALPDESLNGAMIAKGQRSVVLWMLGSDDISNSQSGTLYRFVQKVAAHFGINTRTVAAEERSEPQRWDISRQPLMVVPEPAPLIDYAQLRQAIQDGISNGISEAEMWKRRHG
jgi:hypothetical protein